MSEEKKVSFLNYPINHLTSENVESLAGAYDSSKISEEENTFVQAKANVLKQLWFVMLRKSPTLLRGMIRLADAAPNEVSLIGLATDSMIAGLTYGYALGINFPPNEASQKDFDAAVAKLLDRREHGCDDPNCLACQLKKAFRMERDQKEPSVM